MELAPHSNYDPRHFPSGGDGTVGYDTGALHLVSPSLAALSSFDLNARVKALGRVGSAGNRKRKRGQVVPKPDGAVIWISLASVFYGSNAVPLTPAHVLQALMLVAEALGVRSEVVLGARVYRLDVAANLALRLRPSEYVRRLLHVSRAARHPYSATSWAFVNRTRELAFYDKAAELREKGRPVPGSFDGLNVLRYELRMMRGLTRVFGEPVYAADLAGPTVYRRAVVEWAGRFETVRTQSVPDIEAPKRVPELMRALAAGYVADHGADVVLEAIEANHADGLIEQHHRDRQRKRVLELAAGTGAAQGDPVAELHAAVQASKSMSLSALS